ncbi:hypothetical protein ACFPK9_05640 [Rubritalea spongiae]|uniref:Porin n=2 Tax=Rubritalea spongiae TaxID=430797 RepID=A0ABW5E410_9BACT
MKSKFYVVVAVSAIGVFYANASSVVTPVFDADSYLYIGTNNAYGPQISLGESQRGVGTYHFNFGVIEFDVSSLSSEGSKYLELSAVEYILLSGGTTGAPIQTSSSTGAASVNLVALDSSYSDYQVSGDYGGWYDTYVENGSSPLGTYNFTDLMTVRLDITSTVNGWIDGTLPNNGFALYSTSGNVELASSENTNNVPRIVVSEDTGGSDGSSDSGGSDGSSDSGGSDVSSGSGGSDVSSGSGGSDGSSGSGGSDGSSGSGGDPSNNLDEIVYTNYGEFTLTEARAAILALVLKSGSADADLMEEAGVSSSLAQAVIDSLNAEQVAQILGSVAVAVENSSRQGLRLLNQSGIAHLDFFENSLHDAELGDGERVGWEFFTNANYYKDEDLDSEQYGAEVAAVNSIGVKNFNVGVALAYTKASRELLNGDNDLKGSKVSLGSSYLIDEWNTLVTGICSFGGWDSEMNVGSTKGETKGSTTAMHISAEVLDAFALGNVSFTPVTSFSWFRSDLDPYEFGILDFDEASNQVNIWRLGLKGLYSIDEKSTVRGLIELAQRTSDDSSYIYAPNSDYWDYDDSWMKLGLRYRREVFANAHCILNVTTTTEGSDPTFGVNVGFHQKF